MARYADIPYWRLSSFYFFYFAFLGAWVPFWNLYLEQELLFSAPQIAYLSAAMMLSKILGPYLWGWAADKFHQRLWVIRIGAFAAVLCFLPVFTHQLFEYLLFSIFLYSFFWNAILSQFEVLTLTHLHGKTEFYAQIRLWGSVGFIVAVAGLGFVFEVMSLNTLPYFLLFFLLAIGIASLSIPHAQKTLEKTQTKTNNFSVFRRQFLTVPVIIFMAISFLMQFSHGPYYTFFSIYLEQLNYSRPLIGGLWSLGVVAEVLLFIVMHHFLRYFSLKRLLIITLLLTAMRWFMLSLWADNLALLLLAQLLHAASFASFHSISMAFLQHSFSPQCQGQGQASYSALSYGAGGALGAIISGEYWHMGAEYLFMLAAISVCFALLLLLFLGKRPLTKTQHVLD